MKKITLIVVIIIFLCIGATVYYLNRGDRNQTVMIQELPIVTHYGVELPENGTVIYYECMQMGINEHVAFAVIEYDDKDGFADCPWTWEPLSEDDQRHITHVIELLNFALTENGYAPLPVQYTSFAWQGMPGAVWDKFRDMIEYCYLIQDGNRFFMIAKA